MALGNDEHSHSHDGEADPHDDPEKNRLMGNFHNNEGIEAASKEQWEEAIRNFKMALHHIKDSEKALINMSTSYLKLGKYDEALKTLKELEAITARPSPAPLQPGLLPFSTRRNSRQPAGIEKIYRTRVPGFY